MNWRLPLQLLVPVTLALVAAGCGVASRREEGEDGGPDGAPADSGQLPDTLPDYCRLVSRVIDGDTIDYVDRQGGKVRVRLLGIDTKERGEPCYDRGRSALTALIGGQYIRMENDPGAEDRDRYDRELRYVSPCEDQAVGSINLRMVEEGLACVFMANGLGLEAALRTAEREAARTRRGCWENDPRFCSE